MFGISSEPSTVGIRESYLSGVHRQAGNICQAKRLHEAERPGVSLVDARSGFGTRTLKTRIPTGTTSAALGQHSGEMLDFFFLIFFLLTKFNLVDFFHDFLG